MTRVTKALVHIQKMTEWFGFRIVLAFSSLLFLQMALFSEELCVIEHAEARLYVR